MLLYTLESGNAPGGILSEVTGWGCGVLCYRSLGKAWQFFLASPEAGPRHRFGVQCSSRCLVDPGCDICSPGGQAQEGFPVSISWKDLVSVFLGAKEETYLI